MSKLRLPLWSLMVSVVLFALGFAALKNPTQAVAGWMFLGTLGTLLLGFVGMATRRGRARLGYLGFVLFGWGYLALAISTGELVRPHLPTNLLLDQHKQLFIPPPYLMAGTGPGFEPLTEVDNYSDFHRVGHCLFTLMFGLLGSVLARFLGPKPTGTYPMGRE